MAADAEYLEHLYRLILSRKDASPEESYIAKLFGKGRLKIAQKVGEEAVEVAIAATSEGKQELVSESADLLFHLLVLWVHSDVAIDDVFAEMKRREGTSGLDAKKSRKQKESL